MCKSVPFISQCENCWKRTANCVARHIKLSVAGFGTRNVGTKTLNKLHSASIPTVCCDTPDRCNTCVTRESQLLTSCTVHTKWTDFKVSPDMKLTDCLTDLQLLTHTAVVTWSFTWLHAQNSSRRSLLSEGHAVSQRKQKSDFPQAQTQRTAVAAPRTELARMQHLCTEDSTKYGHCRQQLQLLNCLWAERQGTRTSDTSVCKKTPAPNFTNTQ